MQGVSWALALAFGLDPWTLLSGLGLRLGFGIGLSVWPLGLAVGLGPLGLAFGLGLGAMPLGLAFWLGR